MLHCRWCCGLRVQITDDKNTDWLRDRWQAAKDMTGKPIEGPQWVMIDLGKRAQITRLVLGAAPTNLPVATLDTN